RAARPSARLPPRSVSAARLPRSLLVATEVADVQHQAAALAAARPGDLHADQGGALGGDAGVEQRPEIAEPQLLLAHGARAGRASNEQGSLDVVHPASSISPAAVAPDGLLHFLRVLREVLLHLRVGDPQ